MIRKGCEIIVGCLVFFKFLSFVVVYWKLRLDMWYLNFKLKEKKKGVIICKLCFCVWFSIISFVVS